MGRRAWWLSALAVLVILPVLATVGLVVLDPNDYKPAIIEAVQNATGRTLTLNGPMRLRWSLWPTIEVSDVTLANLPGGSRPDIARAERIEAQLSLPALLWRRIEVVKLTLVGPNILFEQAGGKPNWVFSPPGHANTTPAETSGTPFQLRIRNVYVRNGMVTWRLPARTKVVGIRALELQHHTDGGPLHMEAVLVYSDNQPFSLQASAQPTAGLAGPWITQLAFAAFDTTASATGTMDVAGNYDLQVKATAGAMEKLNVLLPDMRLPAVHRATLSTHLMNGPVPGDLPVVGATRLHFDNADLSGWVPGLKLGAADVSLPAAGALATVVSAGQLAGQPFTLGGTFRVPIHPDARESVALDLNAQAATGGDKAVSGSLGLRGNLTLDALRFGGLDVAAALRTPKLAAVRPLLSRRLPALTDVQFDGRLVVPADVGSVSFRGARLLTHEGDLAGDGMIGLGAARVLDAKLRSTKLDLDATLQAFGIGLTASAAPGGATGPMIPATPLPWAALRGPAIDVTGGIGAMTFQNQVWHQVELALQLKNGRVRAGTVKLALPGGPLDLSMTADASADPELVSLAVHAPSIPLALVAGYAGLPGKVSGAMRIDAQFRAAGRSARDVAASLEGPVSASAIGGELSNAAFIKLTSASLDALGIKVPAQGKTTLRCLDLVGSFAKGVGRFRTIALETTYLSVAGAGQVDLGQETVALKLNPLAQISGAAVSVPVIVEGPFRGITGRLDANGFDKLGLLIEAWFGGDHPDTCSDAGLVATRSRDR
ncbi:MAG: AsmA family protein [Pseudomonadota bacterium]|nr:AsmA family protein [Pseudomonadota bacterium]